MTLHIVLLMWLVDKFTENCASLHGKGICYIWEICRAMHMPCWLDLCFILSLLSLQGICLTVSFPYLISLYFVIGSSCTSALYRSVECCDQVGRTLHIQGASGSNYDSKTGHSDRSSVSFLSSPKQMLTFGPKTFFYIFSNFLFTNHSTIQH